MLVEKVDQEGSQEASWARATGGPKAKKDEGAGRGGAFLFVFFPLSSVQGLHIFVYRSCTGGKGLKFN